MTTEVDTPTPAANQRVHDPDLDPDRHNLQAQRITNE